MNVYEVYLDVTIEGEHSLYSSKGVFWAKSPNSEVYIGPKRECALSKGAKEDYPLSPESLPKQPSCLMGQLPGARLTLE